MNAHGRQLAGVVDLRRERESLAPHPLSVRSNWPLLLPRAKKTTCRRADRILRDAPAIAAGPRLRACTSVARASRAQRSAMRCPRLRRGRPIVARLRNPSRCSSKEGLRLVCDGPLRGFRERHFHNQFTGMRTGIDQVHDGFALLARGAEVHQRLRVAMDGTSRALSNRDRRCSRSRQCRAAGDGAAPQRTADFIAAQARRDVMRYGCHPRNDSVHKRYPAGASQRGLSRAAQSDEGRFI